MPSLSDSEQRRKLFIQPRMYAVLPIIMSSPKTHISLVYSMAQTSKAVVPKDPGGSFAYRIGVSVSGSLSWTLVVNAFVTPRVSSTDDLQYSLVVLNCKYSIVSYAQLMYHSWRLTYFLLRV